MEDRELGISIRFIKQWREPTAEETARDDQAFALAMQDEREVPFILRLLDAYAFLKQRIN